ncbi:MAG TPA: hypothetical protein DHV28_02295 [Ignavibacteriales bacterium]|nr:hypothetical protein [Ignavibacteriales bacterium]
MKKLSIFLFVICFFASAYPQQFSRLNGLEEPQGQTILLYSFGNDMNGLYVPVFKYFVNTGIETQIIDAYSIQIDTFQYHAKSVSDYEFFPNDENNFINVGLTIDIDVLGYAARNDTITYTDWGIFFVDISKQHPNQVYISDFHKVIKSFDGGYTYPADSTIDFEFLSVADFDDRVFFGTDNNRLIKTEDQGTTFSIVDTSNLQTTKPGLAFYYDVNQFHIYRLNRSNGKFTLNVSNNKGNAFSWTKTYESDTQFFIAIDSTQSGVVFLADGRRIYKSTNNGYTFFEYKSLPSKLVGIYKKPNSEILYAASKYQLYEIRPDTTVIIKSVPIPMRLLDYYPLSIGNYWIYKVTDWSYPYYSEDTFTRRVVSKEILSNNKEYFKIEEKYHNSAYTNYLYERIDSAKGLVYRFDNECQNPDSEKVIDDFTAEVGDSLLIQRFTMCWDSILTYISEVGSESIFNENRNFRTYEYSWLMSYTYKLAQGIGIYNIRNGYDFGESNFFLNGCVIDDIVYGDTTLTDVDDELNSLPAQYKLEQNYPNPFNPSTKISWQLPVSSWVTLKIFDALGREVETLVNEYQDAGVHSTLYIVNQPDRQAGSTLSSGIYFYQLKVGKFVETKKMMFLK